MEPWELKAHGAARRKANLSRVRDGVDWGRRVIEPGSIYSRGIKHRPRSPEDWESLD